MPKGLYANIHAKRKRVKAGSGETMRKKGAKVHQQQKHLNKLKKQLNHIKRNEKEIS